MIDLGATPWWSTTLFFLLSTVYIYVQAKKLRKQKERVQQQSAVLEQTISELKQRQQQLVQSEKMASLGQLTAGVAHEINNPINFVSGSITPLKRDISEIMQLLEIYSSLDRSNYSSKLDEILKYRDQIDLNFTIEEITSLIKKARNCVAGFSINTVLIKFTLAVDHPQHVLGSWQF
jgi:phosphoglycerate-specific signal transduction histidine kinase